jgi:amidase
MTGHLPGGAHQHPGFSTLLAVAGPMARTADDLEAGLRVLAGPEPPDSTAFQWALPPPRHNSLRDYRIGYMLEDPAVPVSAETKSVLEAAVRACEKAGAKVTEGWPDGLRFQELIDTYLFMLGAFDFSMSPPESQQARRAALEQRPDPMSKGSISSFADWQRMNLKRLAYRAMWAKYFESTDVFLMPTMFTAAFEHDHTPVATRVITTPEGGKHSFMDMLKYISPATLTGCPATTAPVGLSKSGLPVGLQIVGPYLEDATPIGFAALLAREIGGFQPPPGYRDVP